MLIRIGLIFFYVIDFLVWSTFALGIMAGADIRKPLGLLGAFSVPIVGLFIMASGAFHSYIAVAKRYEKLMIPLFIINLMVIIGFVILVFLVLNFALYR